MDSNRLKVPPLHMRKHHVFTSSDRDSTLTSDEVMERKGLKVKGHGLWTLNVTVGKTEI